MKTRRSFVFLVGLAVFLCADPASAGDEYVNESARAVPLAYETDIVIVGANIGGVAAALTAARSGKHVVIVTSCPFFDETIAGTGRYWLGPEDRPLTELGEEIFDGTLYPGKPEGYRHIHPARFKKRLDALLTKNITVVFQSYGTDVIVGNQGNLSGVCIANKGGRQAVLAKVVIDATPMAGVARLAGARLEEWPAEKKIPVFQTMTWDPEEKESEGRFIMKCNLEGERPVALREYKVQTLMPTGDWANRCRSAQLIRKRYPKAKAEWAGHMVRMIEPTAVICRARHDSSPWVGPEKMSVDCCRPVGLKRLYVLSSACNVSRENAELLMRPPGLIALGEQVGRAAASEAESLPMPRKDRVKVDVYGQQGTDRTVDVRERLLGVRPFESYPGIEQPAGSLPVWGDYDVVVVGGGTAGAPAAISAARAGARVLLVEMSGVLGGVGSNGVGWFFTGYREGFAREFIEAGYPNFRGAHPDDYPDKRGAERDRPFMFPLQRSYWLSGLLEEAGCDVWFTTLGVGTLNEGDTVRGVVVATPLGRGAVRAKTVIDATGDGDICVAAGAEFNLVSPLQPYLQNAGYSADHAIVDGFMNDNRGPFDPADMEATVSFLRKSRGRPLYSREYRDMYDFYYQVLFRETRKIKCDYTMTFLDQLLVRRYRDAIAVTKAPFDQHGSPSSIYSRIGLRDDRESIQSTPFRALLPKGLHDILVTGRCRSATHDALPKTRMQADMMNEGYAAGYCAALSAMNNVGLRDIDIKQVQEHLLEIEALPDETFTADTPVPTDAELKAAADDPSGRNAALLLAWPKRGLPRLRASFASAPTPGKAHLLCLIGDRSPVPYLLEQIEKEPTAADKLPTIWALGEARDPAAVPALKAFLAPGRTYKLERKQEHPVKAAAIALGKIADKSAVPELKRYFDSVEEKKQVDEPAFTVGMALHACGRDMSSYFREIAKANDKLLARRAAMILAAPAGAPLGGTE